jgi:hypothetical protein
MYVDVNTYHRWLYVCMYMIFLYTDKILGIKFNWFKVSYIVLTQIRTYWFLGKKKTGGSTLLEGRYILYECI